MKLILAGNSVEGAIIMKLLLIFLATAYASVPTNELGSEKIIYEPIGYEQPGYDRYSYGYGNPDFVGYGGLIEVPYPYVVGRQGIGFDKRTAYAYGFRRPLTTDLFTVLRRYPDKESIVKP